MQVNAKEFRQHLSEYLERASRGQSLDISMRGKAVARLTRIEPTENPKEDALFGIWADEGEENPSEWVRDIRQGRQF